MLFKNTKTKTSEETAEQTWLESKIDPSAKIMKNNYLPPLGDKINCINQNGSVTKGWLST